MKNHIKLVEEAIQSVRIEARKALHSGSYVKYSNLMLDLQDLESLLVHHKEGKAS